MSEHRELIVSPRLKSEGHHKNGGAPTDHPGSAATTAKSSRMTRSGGTHASPRSGGVPPTDRPRRRAQTAHELRTTYRRAGLTGDAVEYAVILRGDPCTYCGAAGGSVDHVENTAHGGAKDDWANLTSACLRCNGSKQHTPLLRFLLDRAKLADAYRRHA